MIQQDEEPAPAGPGILRSIEKGPISKLTADRLYLLTKGTNMEQTYQQRAASYLAEAQALKKRFNRLALARLAVFIGGILAVVYAWGFHWGAGLGCTLIFLVLFYRFIQRHPP